MSLAQVMESKPVQKALKQVALEALSAVQDHLSSIALSLKTHSGMSWAGYGRARNALSREFEDDPSDSDDEDAENIGTYAPVALYLQPTHQNGLLEELEVQMPHLPSRYMLRKEEVEICRKYGAFELSEDGLATTRDFNDVLLRALKLHWQKLRKFRTIVVQIMGDGFRMNRCGKYVNFVLRVCGVHVVSGSHTSCETLAIWSGDDSYEFMQARVAPQFEAAAALNEKGTICFEGGPAAATSSTRGTRRQRVGGGDGPGGGAGHDRGGRTRKRAQEHTTEAEAEVEEEQASVERAPTVSSGAVTWAAAQEELRCHVEESVLSWRKDIRCHVVGGGDALYTNDILGLGGFACKYPCNFCECPKDKFHLKPVQEGTPGHTLVPRTYERALALSHARPAVWPLKCPVCGPITEAEWEAEYKKTKGKSWFATFSLGHFAQQYLYPPLLRGVDHIDHPMCVLHVLLSISGTIYKHAISQNVENVTQALTINTYLHGYLKIYIPKAKVVSKTEAATLLKRPSFVGSEAPKVLEHLEMVMHLLNYTASSFLESEAAAEGGRGVPDDDVDGWGPPLTVLQDLQLKATLAFTVFYNAIAKRLVDAQDEAQRKAKAYRVQKLGFDFLDAYKLAFGDGACTPYVHIHGRVPPRDTDL
jgi:hypothetical protein